MTPARPGRMPRWQRWTTCIVLSTCAATGVVWFVELDLLDLGPPTTRPWWIAHGVTAVVAALVIGGAAVQHVVVTWRTARGRRTGALNVALLASLLLTALYLMYGAEPGHDLAHWVHAVGGIAAVFAFAGHVLWGRTRAPRSDRAGTAESRSMRPDPSSRVEHGAARE